MFGTAWSSNVIDRYLSLLSQQMAITSVGHHYMRRVNPNQNQTQRTHTGSLFGLLYGCPVSFPSLYALFRINENIEKY